MEKVVYKIGQELEAQKDFEVAGFFGEKSIDVKAGAKAVVDINGYLHWISGKAQGKIQKIENVNIEGYDTDNIANMLYGNIVRIPYIEELLEDDDLAKQEIKEAIEEILDILF